MVRRAASTPPARAKAAKVAKRAKAGKAAPRARLDVDERRAQLVSLGLAMFSERAYDEVSIDDLAKAAGVSKGLLYHYFPTKRDLYVAALEHAAKRLLDDTTTELAGEAVGEPSVAVERLRRGLETYLAFVEQHRKAYVALMRGGIGSDPEVAAILEETRRAFAERIFEGMPGGLEGPLLRLALRGWVGFVEATSLDWVARREVGKQALIELATSLLFDAITRATGVATGIDPRANSKKRF